MADCSKCQTELGAIQANRAARVGRLGPTWHPASATLDFWVLKRQLGGLRPKVPCWNRPIEFLLLY